MKNILVFIKPMNIFTANTSKGKEIFIGALHNRAARLKANKGFTGSAINAGISVLFV
jgi:hypothetical protein